MKTTILTALTIATALVAYGQTNKAEIETFEAPQGPFTNTINGGRITFSAAAWNGYDVMMMRTNQGIFVTRDTMNPVQTNLVIMLMNGESGNSERPRFTINPWTAATNYFVTNVFSHPHVTVSQLPEGTVIARLNGEIIERGGMTTNFNEMMVITTVLRQEVLTFDWNGPRSVTNEVMVSSTRKLKVQVWADKP